METIKPVKVLCKIHTSSGEIIEKEMYTISASPLLNIYNQLTKAFNSNEKISKLCLQVI